MTAGPAGESAGLRVAAASPSFCEHPALVAELLERFPGAKLNRALARLEGAELIAFLEGHDVAVVGLEHMTAEVIGALPELKVIAKLGTGTDMLDLAAMAERGIRLGWHPGANALSIAELVLSFALDALRRVSATNRALRGGAEVRQRMGRLLSGRVFGLHGCGHIGQEVVRLLAPFGCRILAHDLADRGAFYAAHGVESVDFDTLLAEAEILSLHVPLSSATRDLYSVEALGKMRPGAILINTARGELIDEDALEAALEARRLAGFCADVLRSEPAFASPLIGREDVLVTPHIGGSAEEARLAMGRSALRGIFENRVPQRGIPPFTELS